MELQWSCSPSPGPSSDSLGVHYACFIPGKKNCLFLVMVSACGNVHGLVFSHVCMCFSLFIGSTGFVLFVSWDNLLSRLPLSFYVTSLLVCFICFHTIIWRDDSTGLYILFLVSPMIVY